VCVCLSVCMRAHAIECDQWPEGSFKPKIYNNTFSE